MIRNDLCASIDSPADRRTPYLKRICRLSRRSKSGENRGMRLRPAFGQATDKPASVVTATENVVRFDSPADYAMLPRAYRCSLFAAWDFKITDDETREGANAPPSATPLPPDWAN